MADIEMNKLIGNQTYQIKIIPPEGAFRYVSGISSGYIIKGFLTNQITWNSANQWEGLHSGLRTMKDNEGNMVKGEAVANQAGVDTGDGQHAMTGITETIARWTGAQKPTFGFNVMFIALDAKSDIITPIKMLIRGALPHQDSGKVLKGTMMAPYGYKTGITGEDEAEPDEAEDYWSNGGRLQGTWTVQVGKWFKAPKLVLNSVSVNFSQQCAPNGKPLFAEAQLVFETWRLPKADELERFFGASFG
jgi:hypothetical protein